MSYVVYVVVIDPRRSVADILDGLHPSSTILAGATGEQCEDRDTLPYLPSLLRRLRLKVQSTVSVFYFYADNVEGYATASPFVRTPAQDEEPEYVSLPRVHRADVEGVLETLLRESQEGLVVFVAEPGWSFEDDDFEERYERFRAADMMTTAEFWARHDRGRIETECIYPLTWAGR